ncbi:MAG: NAD-dependent epimerase/dehydratase family protein [Bdellovibrionales bacterium]|nr:NAD-dependent epimerase/dehydratase family protein [Bdellovibrionales bacterium]
MKENLRIGITGGLGFIGIGLRKQINRRVVFISRELPKNALKPTETCLVGSFINPEIREEFVKNIDVLIHAASLVGPRSSYDSLIIENDLVGTIDLAKAFFAKNPNGHFIFLSTSGGLYDLGNPDEKSEESELFPDNLYGSIKMCIENFLEEKVKKNGVVTILRPAPIYGDSLKKNQTNGLIDKLLRSTLSEDPTLKVSIFDKMESSRDYLHIDDLVEAIDLVIDRDQKSRFEVYNIGTGIGTSIEKVLHIVNAISSKRPVYEILQVDKPASYLTLNSDKIFKEIGWKPKVSLLEGVLKMYRDLKKIILQ